MQIDMAYADKLTQRIVTEASGTFLRTFNGATVVDEVELLGIVAGRLPSEINDIMQGARVRASMANSGAYPIVGRTNPPTGMVEFLAGSDAVISSGTAAPNDADGKPDGSIYFQI